MKKIMSLILVTLMILSTTAMASEGEATLYTTSTPQPDLYNLDPTVSYLGNDMNSLISAQEINGVTMIPLRSTLKAMGYTITWNSDEKNIEILKGAQWTSITIGKNAYFKNKMAPHKLSSEPILLDNHTLVPIEFIADIIGKGIEINNSRINITDNEAVIHSGFVKSITEDMDGNTTITLTTDLTSDSIELQTIIHTQNTSTIYNRKVVEGDNLQIISSMIMTMSLPGQTTGYIIY